MTNFAAVILICASLQDLFLRKFRLDGKKNLSFQQLHIHFTKEQGMPP